MSRYLKALIYGGAAGVLWTGAAVAGPVRLWWEELTATSPSLVWARDLPEGATLASADLKPVRVAVTVIEGSSALSRRDALVGLRLTCTVKAGEIVVAGCVEKP